MSADRGQLRQGIDAPAAAQYPVGACTGGPRGKSPLIQSPTIAFHEPCHNFAISNAGPNYKKAFLLFGSHYKSFGKEH
jgi:hypothetical protein